MKKLHLILILISISLILNAQRPILVNEALQKFGNDELTGYSVLIPEVKFETVRNEWIKVLERPTQSKVMIDGNEISIFGTFNKNISDNAINFFSYLTNNDSTVVLFVSAETKRNQYITAGTVESDKFVSVLKDFAKNQYSNLYEQQIRNEETKLSSLEKELKNLCSKNKSIEKKIKSSTISKNKHDDEIASLKKQHEFLNSQLFDMEKQFLSMDKGAEKSKMQKKISTLKDDKDDIVKKISKLENKIDKVDDSNKDNSTEINDNLKEQELLQKRIDAQKDVLLILKEKLRNIKQF